MRNWSSDVLFVISGQIQFICTAGSACEKSLENSNVAAGKISVLKYNAVKINSKSRVKSVFILRKPPHTPSSVFL